MLRRSGVSQAVSPPRQVARVSTRQRKAALADDDTRSRLRGGFFSQRRGSCPGDGSDRPPHRHPPRCRLRRLRHRRRRHFDKPGHREAAVVVVPGAARGDAVAADRRSAAVAADDASDVDARRLAVAARCPRARERHRQLCVARGAHVVVAAHAVRARLRRRPQSDDRHHRRHRHRRFARHLDDRPDSRCRRRAAGLHLDTRAGVAGRDRQGHQR